MKDNSLNSNILCNVHPLKDRPDPEPGQLGSNMLFAISLKSGYWYDFNGNPEKGFVNISFDPKQGAWSNLGYIISLHSESNTTPTMNLGFMYLPNEFTFEGITYKNYSNDPVINILNETGTVVRHEFGHTLSLHHEHLNNIPGSKNPIEYNYENLYKEYSGIGAPGNSGYCNTINFNNLDPNIIKTTPPDSLCKCPDGSDCSYDINRYNNIYFNIVEKLNSDYYEGTNFDYKSVMLYGIDNYFIKGCENVYGYCDKNPTNYNSTYSDIDREYLSKLYPKYSNDIPIPEITIRYIYEPGHVITYNDIVKEKWVKKIITEDLESFIGFKFNFQESTASTESPKEPIKLKPEEIAGIVVGIIVFLFILMKIR